MYLLDITNACNYTSYIQNRCKYIIPVSISGTKNVQKSSSNRIKKNVLLVQKVTVKDLMFSVK